LDTENNPKKPLRFVILIPHRDSAVILNQYRARLFSLDFPGAHSFPSAAPLAGLSRPLSRDELKGLARNIRALVKGNGGKIIAAGTAMAETQKLSFFGPRMNLSLDVNIFPETAREKVLFILFPPVLCAALVYPEDCSPDDCSKAENPRRDETPALSFRAAALANLAVRPLSAELRFGEYSFEWRIGPPVWLPADRKK
jgi:hypothetical protein